MTTSEHRHSHNQREINANHYSSNENNQKRDAEVDSGSRISLDCQQ